MPENIALIMMLSLQWDVLRVTCGILYQMLGKCTRCGRTGNITAPLNENAPLVRSIENELLNFRSYGQ